MNEITHGVRSLLSYSWVYDWFQRVVGRKNGRALIAAKYIKAQTGDRVLDIGCGTAKWRTYLPDVEYYGFDPNPNYIQSASETFRNIPLCTFLCASIDDVTLDLRQKYDIALAIGVLHHLDDAAVVRLARLAQSALKTSGRLIIIDPCYFKGQSFVARRLIKLDRGQHVRDIDAYLGLLNAVFNNVHYEIRHNALRIPYTHLVTECRAE